MTWITLQRESPYRIIESTTLLLILDSNDELELGRTSVNKCSVDKSKNVKTCILQNYTVFLYLFIVCSFIVQNLATCQEEFGLLWTYIFTGNYTLTFYNIYN